MSPRLAGAGQFGLGIVAAEDEVATSSARRQMRFIRPFVPDAG
jgi:hypothetical protein